MSQVHTQKTLVSRIRSDVPELIKKYNPDVKIIIITCSPSSRAYSDYLHTKELVKRKSSVPWVGPLSNLLFRTFRNSNQTFEEIVDDFLQTSQHKSAASIGNEIDHFHGLENQVFEEINAPINRPLVDIIAEREIAAISKSPIDPKFEIFLHGIYHQFLQRWLQHFTLNEERFQT